MAHECYLDMMLVKTSFLQRDSMRACFSISLYFNATHMQWLQKQCFWYLSKLPSLLLIPFLITTITWRTAFRREWYLTKLWSLLTFVTILFSLQSSKILTAYPLNSYLPYLEWFQILRCINTVTSKSFVFFLSSGLKDSLATCETTSSKW